MPYQGSRASGNALVTDLWASIVCWSRGGPVGDVVKFFGEVKNGGPQGTPVVNETVNIRIHLTNIPEYWGTLLQSANTNYNGKYEIEWTIPWSIEGHRLACLDWAFKPYIQKYDFWGAQQTNVYVAYKTRIVLGPIPPVIKANENVTISGRLEWEKTPGVWDGFGGQTVYVFYDGTELGNELTSRLDPGAFSITGKIPTAGTYSISVEYRTSGVPAYGIKKVYPMSISVGAKLVTYGMVVGPLVYLTYKKLR